LVQANLIRKTIETATGWDVEIEIIKTQGDRIDHLSFDKMEGKGFFTKELEQALLEGSVDLAVHSLKDLPTTQPDGLKLGAVGFRADRRELLLINNNAVAGDNFLPIKPGGVIGTSSARRQALIRHHNPELTLKDLRGNVPTRIRKLRDGQYDAIVIASAGVERLGLDLSDLTSRPLDPKSFPPAPAQGVLGLQIRESDDEVDSVVAALNDQMAADEVALERGLLARFDAGCSLPLAVYSETTDNAYRLLAALGSVGDDSPQALRWVDVSGDSIKTIVTEAFDQLTKS
jgi:hydroxymethylbilane synthase